MGGRERENENERERSDRERKQKHRPNVIAKKAYIAISLRYVKLTTLLRHDYDYITTACRVPPPEAAFQKPHQFFTGVAIVPSVSRS